MSGGFYKALFEHNPDGIFSFDLQGNLLHANPAAERMCGYTVEDFQRITIQTLIPLEYVERGLRHFKNTAKGKSQEFEIVLRHKHGHRIEVNVKSFPIFIDHEIVGVYGMMKDITKYKQLEEDLKSAREQLELFLKNTVDSIVILDLQFHILKVNRAFERMFGWTEQEVIGRPIPTTPDFLRNEFTALSQEIVNGRHITAYETVRQHKNGSLIDVIIYISPILDAKGSLVAFAGILRDITERKRAEESLKESEKQLRTLINNMPDLVCFKNGEGHWMEVNEYGLSVFQLEDFPYQGKTNAELASFNDYFFDVLGNCERTDQQVWASSSTVRYEQVIPQPNSTSKVFDIIKVPLFHTDGRRKGIVVIGRDITELKRTEELLRKSEKLSVVGQLAAGVAHEIRNPLTTLKGFLKLFESATNESHRRYLDVMFSEINRMEWISNQFMTAAKPQAVAYVPKDPRMLIEQVTVLLYPQATMNNVQIMVNSDADIPLILCEENQLKQVFINILKNAMEAMPNGGEIQVSVKKLDPNLVLIRCIDQGCGIPQDRIPHLGEPFYSLKEKGTGLGLMICYKIIEEHQGMIKIESEINHGTTVDVILPIRSLF